MSVWDSGYVTDIPYTFGYRDDLNPVRVPFSLLTAGFSPPDIRSACELGFGQGLSIAIHSAASDTRWCGNDFNPSQAAHAQALAQPAGSDVLLSDDSFAEFFARADLPDFDFIGMHGIWSWVSEENRALIVDFVRRKLRVGGVLYVSYNTIPGWSAFQAMRHLLAEHVATFGASGGGVAGGLGAAMSFGKRLLDTQPAYAQRNPRVAEQFNVFLQQEMAYVAHELFGRDWMPMPFSETRRRLEAAKLSFLTSTDYFDRIAPMTLTPDQRTILQECPDPAYREQLLDFMVDRQFRRDYWVKGPMRLSPIAAAGKLQQQSVVLVRPCSEISYEVAGAAGNMKMERSVYEPIVAALQDHQPTTVKVLAERLGPSYAQHELHESLSFLIAACALSPAQSPAVIDAARSATVRLNRSLLERARGDASIRHLASPVTGGGVPVPHLHQLFLLARSRGKPDSTWAKFASQLLQSQGHMPPNTERGESPEQELDRMQASVREFVTKYLPVLEGLGVTGG